MANRKIRDIPDLLLVIIADQKNRGILMAIRKIRARAVNRPAGSSSS